MDEQLQPAEGSAFVYVVDDVGLLQRITPEQAEAALKRGEIVPTERDGVAELIPQPLRVLTEEEKYRLRKKEERSRR